ncbi:MAG: hypothetical protein AB7P07_05890 [Hyphomonadaceae bacterium]
MRRFAFVVFASVIAACGQPAAPSAEAAAQSAGASGGGEAAYVEACVARYVAQSAQASQWAPDQCAQDWQRVVASGALAEAILSAGAGTMPAGNRLGADLEVSVDVNARTASWRWAETGGLIPYDAIGALEQRGASTAMIGCSQLGTGEFNKSYAVTPANGAPFHLSVYERSAPTANAESSYSASVYADGRVPTLAQLRSDGMEWSDACAY